MSERVRSGLGTAVVSTNRKDTIADVGCYEAVGGRVGSRIAPSERPNCFLHQSACRAALACDALDLGGCCAVLDGRLTVHSRELPESSRVHTHGGSLILRSRRRVPRRGTVEVLAAHRRVPGVSPGRPLERKRPWRARPRSRPPSRPVPARRAVHCAKRHERLQWQTFGHLCTVADTVRLRDRGAARSGVQWPSARLGGWAVNGWLEHEFWRADDTGAEIEERLGHLVDELALDYFSYGLVTPPRGRGLDTHAHSSLVASYPQEWGERYVSRRYLLLDPVIDLAARSARPFFWGHDAFLRAFRKRQRHVFDEARAYGIVHGLAIRGALRERLGRRVQRGLLRREAPRRGDAS